MVGESNGLRTSIELGINDTINKTDKMFDWLHAWVRNCEILS